MSSPANQDRSLSEISHLFLSAVREKQTAGAARPVRRPPASARRDASIDLTPDEFARQFTQDMLQATSDDTPPHAEPRALKASAIVAAHLGERSIERAKEYAAHFCATQRKRVGLIHVESASLRVTLFEPAGSGSSPPAQAAESQAMDLRHVSEALEELRGDVDQWLLEIPNPRGHEARAILPLLDRLIVLATCDDEGVVACYRSLKGLAEVEDCPALSLALLDTADSEQAEHVFQKLASVSRKFMNVSLNCEPPVQRLPTRSVGEEVVLNAHANASADQPGGALWLVITNFLAQIQKANFMQPRPQTRETEVERTVLSDIVVSEQAEVAQKPYAAQKAPSLAAPQDDDVVDLPNADAGAVAILGAILRRQGGQLIDTPVKPPMRPDASLSVSSDRRLVLLAVARVGLGDLRSIGQAYQWLMQNRALIAMALPQFSIDAHQLPQLHLVIDQADASADILQPMLQSGSVTVQAYRKLRWAGKTGLLLEAA